MRVSSWCAVIATTALAGGCVRPGPTTQGDEHWTPVPNAYATHFAIFERDQERSLLVFGHGGTRDTVGRYAIDGNRDDAVSFGLALHRIAITSTTHAAYISALGASERVVACAHADQVRDDVLRQRIEAGEVRDIGTSDGLDREQLVALRPEAVLGYPFGGEGAALKDLGIPLVQVSEYLEEHPLGRAEWIRFFGVLFGKEDEADSIFRGIVDRYEAVRKSVSRDTLPTVLFGSVWQGQWYVPPGNSYMAKLIEDAGGRYLFADRRSDGNITLDMETMISKGSEADHWGMIAEVNGPVDVETFTHDDPRLSAFKAVREGNLFLGNSATEDLFGRALLEPDVLLSILHEYIAPGLIVDRPMGYRPRYFAGMYREPPPPKTDIIDFTAQ